METGLKMIPLFNLYTHNWWKSLQFLSLLPNNVNAWIVLNYLEHDFSKAAFLYEIK